MKDFNEFLATLTPGVFMEIFNDAKEKAEDTKYTKRSNMSSDQIGAACFTIALELIGQYHKWLNDTDS